MQRRLQGCCSPGCRCGPCIIIQVNFKVLGAARQSWCTTKHSTAHQQSRGQLCALGGGRLQGPPGLGGQAVLVVGTASRDTLGQFDCRTHTLTHTMPGTAPPQYAALNHSTCPKAPGVKPMIALSVRLIGPLACLQLYLVEQCP
jgi:hypothetical protein